MEGFELLFNLASMKHGWAQAKPGHGEAGIEELREALKVSVPLGRHWFQCLLAESLVDAQDAEGALAVRREVRAGLEQTHDRFWVAEIHRLQEEALAQLEAAAAEIEPCFRMAVDVARGQGARALELRAVAS